MDAALDDRTELVARFVADQDVREVRRLARVDYHCEWLEWRGA